MTKSNSDEDCISRAEVQKHIYRRLWESALNNVGYECKAEDVFMDIADNRLSTWISEIPSIQPKPKTDVLDKIRAEIKEESRFCPLTEGLERALEIINEYTAEETWEGIHAQVTAPKGTFDKIWNEAEEDNDEI